MARQGTMVYWEKLDTSWEEQCLAGKTPNSNESFHALLRSVCPKERWGNLRTVDTGLAIAVQRFNEGTSALLDVMLGLELVGGSAMEGYALQEDTARVVKATRKASSKGKEGRKRIEAARNLEQQERCELEGGYMGLDSFRWFVVLPDQDSAVLRLNGNPPSDEDSVSELDTPAADTTAADCDIENDDSNAVDHSTDQIPDSVPTSSLEISPDTKTTARDTIKYQVNNCIVVRYEDQCYPGLVTLVEGNRRKVNFLHPRRTKKRTILFPVVQDIQNVPLDMIVCEAEISPAGNSLREWHVLGYDF